jgi:hypothetical protein
MGCERNTPNTRTQKASGEPQNRSGFFAFLRISRFKKILRRGFGPYYLLPIS